MKKIIASLLAICICAVLLVGCGETTTQETPNNTQTEETSGNVQVTETETTTQETPNNTQTEETSGNVQVTETETVTSEPATVLATGECGENITWTWDDSETLTLSGEGDIMDFTMESFENSPWSGFREALEKLVIEEGITGIGDYCFEESKSLLNIVLPDSLERIGDRAFLGCEKLQSLEIPDSVISVGEYAFNACYSLQSLEIPDSVISVGENAFKSCSSLQSIVIGDGLTEIPDGAFDTRESTGRDTFQSKLKEVTFGKNIQTISSSAFFLSTVESLIFTGDAVEDITNFSNVNNCVLYYPKDNPTWVDSGVFANWDGKVEGY